VAFSKLLLLNCENVAFAPPFVAALSAGMRHHLCEVFQASIEGLIPITEVADVNFFQLPELDPIPTSQRTAGAATAPLRNS
jgi:hypothetical protein